MSFKHIQKRAEDLLEKEAIFYRDLGAGGGYLGSLITNLKTKKEKTGKISAGVGAGLVGGGYLANLLDSYNTAKKYNYKNKFYKPTPVGIAGTAGLAIIPLLIHLLKKKTDSYTS